MANLKKLTILHSNDLHGDFLAEPPDAALVGGISMLSGYVNKVREEEPNTIYCIAGDMLQGSIIDSEFKGISTIEIMNLLGPDVASVGNHEVDYGLAHLLFLERCAKFPIVNANLFIKSPYTRLFNPHVILEIDGMKIMFIGVITEDIMMGIRNDGILGSFVDVADAAKEIGSICNAYRTVDIDFTVLLTHIGFEEDCKLAALLDPAWGVDLIIGGHSHTILEHPTEVAGILIAQAGVGTRQVGRFDLVVDTDKNAVHSYEWQLIPIDASHCPRDEEMEATIARFKEQTDSKYNRVLCHFPHKLTHPSRYRETELGNLFCDALQSSLGTDIVMLGSGSIRKKEVDAMLTYGGLLEVFPYDDKMLQLKVTGAQLQRMYAYMLRDEALTGGHTEFYQFSRGMEVVYNSVQHRFEKFNYSGAAIQPAQMFTVAMQSFHFDNFADCFGFAKEEIRANGREVVLTTSILDVLNEVFTAAHHPTAKVESRLVVI